MVDGIAASNCSQELCLDRIIHATEGLEYHFLVGNHDLYCFSRTEIASKYRFGTGSKAISPEKLYYSVCQSPRIRLIFLDTYDISVIGASSVHLHEEAIALLTSNNPSVQVSNLSRGNWMEGTTSKNDHFVPYNGSLGPDQFEWLRHELTTADLSNQKCIIFSHIPLTKECGPSCVAIFHHDELNSILRSSPSVVACIAGHDHTGWYLEDGVGIHHIIPPAPIECAMGEVSYGVIDIFEDGMTIDWVGRLPPEYARWPQTKLKFRPFQT
jgi:hypothetical protein